MRDNVCSMALHPKSCENFHYMQNWEFSVLGIGMSIDTVLNRQRHSHSLGIPIEIM